VAHQPRRRKRAESGPVGTTRHGYARSSRPSSRRRLRGGRHHCWSFHGSRVDRGVPGHGAEAGRPRGDGAIAMPNVGDAPHERRARCGKCPLIGTQGGPHHGHAWPARGDTHCGDTAGCGCERVLSLFDLTPITRRGQPHWYTQATPRQMRAHINTSHTHAPLHTHEHMYAQHGVQCENRSQNEARVCGRPSGQRGTDGTTEAGRGALRVRGVRVTRARGR
jgi:hypothetical protein